MKIEAVFLFFYIAACHSRVPEKIIGGRLAEDKEFPFQVSIRINGVHICGGVIIDEALILTAAHCMFFEKVFLIEASEFDVLVGTNMNYNGNFGGHYKVCKILVHEDFNSDPSIRHKNDIAMLLLNRPIEFSERALPIRLRTTVLPDKTHVELSGWGSQNCEDRSTVFLRSIELTTISNRECSTFFRITIFPENLCAHDFRRRCSSYGDSGSGLIAGDELVGIVSQGNPEWPQDPTVFIRISTFVNWIKKASKNIQRSAKESCQRVRSQTL